MGHRDIVLASGPRRAELLRTFVLLHTPISEHTLTAFERDVQRRSALMGLT